MTTGKNEDFQLWVCREKSLESLVLVCEMLNRCGHFIKAGSLDRKGNEVFFKVEW